eukprot:CAMPEP_0206230908 /NCGR_PEP_ID=MMETSP0047_2-20121206/10538_1 /ASSEMBLY_ACC=CAM_ASM_000192 /TAXON_ID=195065 /ORGANISM="Chroomonas mesostigmatica_cf, Strain CCMP1168" /LENGTH=2187 /DNA_ID=CAMNT_0053654419 /DNA_START=28 /DNA_END=6591 /DNA_ORIENTATION=+
MSARLNGLTAAVAVLAVLPVAIAFAPSSLVPGLSTRARLASASLAPRASSRLGPALRPRQGAARWSCKDGREAVPDAEFQYLKERDACGVGFVASKTNTATHEIVYQATTALGCMEHRGACGGDYDSGDGSGMMTMIPWDLFGDYVKPEEIPHSGVGMVFLPPGEEKVQNARDTIEEIAAEAGFEVKGWRVVPVKHDVLGPMARANCPEIEQIILTSKKGLTGDELEQALYLVKRTFLENLKVHNLDWVEDNVYICSLSSKTIVYKGMVRSVILAQFYEDLVNPEYKSRFAIYHRRFSTNTQPRWPLAQPFRTLGHNGEINTLLGNINWMKAREAVMDQTIAFPKDAKLTHLDPLSDARCSDSGNLDMCVELLIRAGKSPMEALMIMVPEAYKNQPDLEDKQEITDFYNYYSGLQEAWDGPALLVFSDGKSVGAALDRNGLRPARYLETDELVCMMSETGVVPKLDESKIIKKGRLGPGQMISMDLETGEFLENYDIKSKVAKQYPYGDWLKAEQKVIKKQPMTGDRLWDEEINLIRNQVLFGWSSEDMEMQIADMASTGKETTFCMGDDAPLAVLSDKPHVLFNYFKQRFAQVTNPAIDPLRENLVMSLDMTLGKKGNIVEAPNAANAATIHIESPVMNENEMKQMRESGRKVETLPTFWEVKEGPSGLKGAVERLCEAAEKAVRGGAEILVLSDYAAAPDQSKTYIPPLLAVGAVHHHLLGKQLRLQTSIVSETGQCWSTHHVACLVGFGASAVHPYVAFEAVRAWYNAPKTVTQMKSGKIPNISIETALDNYRESIDGGLYKIMSKIGISLLSSYNAAQIFEAIGLGADVIDTAFKGTVSRVGGLNTEDLANEVISLHSTGFPETPLKSLENYGFVKYYTGKEYHHNSPPLTKLLHKALKDKDIDQYKLFQESLKTAPLSTLRDLLDIKSNKEPISIDEVEPIEEIMKRFCTGGMSLGALSREAHETLAIGMNRIGGKSNSGEGGEDRVRFLPITDVDAEGNSPTFPHLRGLKNGDIPTSKIKQVASGRFGVSPEYLMTADQIEIKLAQGAKPGEGGQLPGPKIDQYIATLRLSKPGVTLISPPPHHDIYSIEDLAQLIYDLKSSNPGARISVKLVSEVGVGVIAAGVAKAKADHILISGHDGGTGAAQWGGIKSTGLPWELGLAETHQTLVMNDLRDRVILETDGQLKTGQDVVKAIMLGAEECGFSTAPLVSLGCIMMRKCHLNVCPVGVATQDPELRKKFKGMPEHVVNFLWMIGEEVREHMAQLGVKTVTELVGRADLLKFDESTRNEKTKNLDLSPILTHALKLEGLINPNATPYNTKKQDHELEKHIDNMLIEKSKAALETKTPVTIDTEIINIQRSAGTMLSHEISKRWGQAGLPDDTITINLTGSTGQSLGAFLTKGVTMWCRGDSNDGTAKGLCGGKVVVVPDERNLSRGFKAEDNIITGNVACYGATSGKAFFRGIAGERFCVRNSGALVVSEGCGDHGLEYMTGGRVVILGEVGKNFSAGMSGGIAWVYDPKGELRFKVNFAEPVRDFERLSGDAYEAELIDYLNDYIKSTGSPVAKRIMDNWEEEKTHFVQVFPLDYKRARKQAADADSWKGKDVMNKPTVEVDVDKKTIKIDAATPDEKDINTKFNKLRGFVEIERKPEPYREPSERATDWGEIYTPVKAHDAERKRQSARCMDCGTPFCQTHSGCPIHNLMPEWNELVFKENWKQALDRLLTTNNFPEFTGRVCPAPCEGACVAGLVAAPVTIKNIEYAIVDRGFKEGWIKPRIPKERTGLNVAVVGSGPAGLAAADEMNQMGHKVTVFERDSRPGGLLMYGIPNMKLDKRVVQRRIALLQEEGIDFICNVHVGQDVTADQLKGKFDAVLLTTGSTTPRDLPIPGRELPNIHFAMEFLGKMQRALFNQNPTLMDNCLNFRTPFKGNKDWRVVSDGSYIDVAGKNVVVIGGGDTGTDCTATSLRQGCKTLVNLELMDKPPESRDEIANAWPAYPRIFRTDYGQEEVKKRDGQDPRKYAVMTKRFIDDGAGNLKAIEIVSLKVSRDANNKPTLAEVPGSEQTIPCDVAILAMGFLGPEEHLVKQFNLTTTPQSNIKALHGSNGDGYTTSVAGIFAAGDCRRGQSLVVWAINEGQRAADAVNKYLLEARAAQAANAVRSGVQSGRSAMGHRSFSTSAAEKKEE